ncbi:SGNH/GDSL hydrolase family protein, partial [Actimicrobium sp. CCI2.3]
MSKIEQNTFFEKDYFIASHIDKSSKSLCVKRSFSSNVINAHTSLFFLLTFILMLSLSTSWAAPIQKGVNYKIMPIGDSITEGKFAGWGGYRAPLQKMLNDNGYSYTFVGKEDHKGNSSFPYTEADQTVMWNLSSDKFQEDPAFAISHPLINFGTYSGTYVNKISAYQDYLINGNLPFQANHEGYGSYRIDQIADGMSNNPLEGHAALPIETTLANWNPDVILLMLGTNDALQPYNPTGGDYASNAASRMKALLDKIFDAKPQIMVVLAQITPIKRNDPSRIDADNRAQAYNLAISKIVSAYQTAGKNIVMVNQHDAFDPATETSDGIHPTAAGFQKMAAVWYEGLTRNSAA